MEYGDDASAAAPNFDLARPSSADVLRELEVLREREGISPTKLREVAPLIQRLPVVEDQRLLRGFSSSDSHLAAYDAIGCVLDHAIVDLVGQQILILTLRYDYNLLSVQPGDGWDTVRQRPSLTARHEFVMAMLNYGRTRYYELVRLAYDELAGQLLLRTTSPCRSAAVQEVVQIPQELVIDQLLALFTMTGQELIRERIAVKALEQVDARWSATGATATERLISVCQQAFDSEYEAAVQAYVNARTREGLFSRPERYGYRWGRYVVTNSSLAYLIDRDPAQSFLDRVESSRYLTTNAPVDIDDGQGRGLKMGRVYRARQVARSYALLGGVLSNDAESAPSSAERLAVVDVLAESRPPRNEFLDIVDRHKPDGNHDD